VHRAVLKDVGTVIVKVRRPGIKRQIDEDVRILRWFVKSVLLALPRFRQFTPLELIDELSRNLHKEIAFRQEASNIVRFVEVFRDFGHRIRTRRNKRLEFGLGSDPGNEHRAPYRRPGSSAGRPAPRAQLG